MAATAGRSCAGSIRNCVPRFHPPRPSRRRSSRRSRVLRPRTRRPRAGSGGRVRSTASIPRRRNAGDWSRCARSRTACRSIGGRSGPDRAERSASRRCGWRSSRSARARAKAVLDEAPTVEKYADVDAIPPGVAARPDVRDAIAKWIDGARQDCGGEGPGARRPREGGVRRHHG